MVKVKIKIGKVAYNIKFAEGTEIHDVFHVLQLKKKVWNKEVYALLPPFFHVIDQMK